MYFQSLISTFWLSGTSSGIGLNVPVQTVPVSFCKGLTLVMGFATMLKQGGIFLSKLAAARISFAHLHGICPEQ